MSLDNVWKLKCLYIKPNQWGKKTISAWKNWEHISQQSIIYLKLPDICLKNDDFDFLSDSLHEPG